MNLILETGASIAGTVAFSLLFGVPTRYYPYCGLIGGAGWLVYAGLSSILSEPVAALLPP